MVNLYSIGALAKHALMHIAFEGKQSPLFPYPVIRGHFPAAPEVAARPLLAARLVEAATPPATGCVGMARRDGELSPADNTRSGIDPIGTVSTIHIALIRAIYLLRLVQWNIKRLLACGATLSIPFLGRFAGMPCLPLFHGGAWPTLRHSAEQYILLLCPK